MGVVAEAGEHFQALADGRECRCVACQDKRLNATIATMVASVERGRPILPVDAAARKEVPIATGFIDYFPDAIAAIAHLSKVGNDQHNPGTPLHWDRSKSGDEADTLMRHFVERGTLDTDGERHSTKMAWRALALLQKELELVKKPMTATEVRERRKLAGLPD